MSQRGIHFANDWISDAIDRLGTSVEPWPPTMIHDWEIKLVADADLEDITREEIEEGIGDLRRYITLCLAEAADHGTEGGSSAPFL